MGGPPTPDELRRATLATEYAGLTGALVNWLRTSSIVLPPLTEKQQKDFRKRLAELHQELFGC